MTETKSAFTAVDDDTFEKAIEASRDRAVVIDFWAGWCGPCRMMKPVLEKLAASPGAPKVFTVDVDIDKTMKTSDRFKIGAMPTYLVIRNGRVVRRIVGADKASVKDVFKKFSKKES